MDFNTLFLYFFIYSIFGWCAEMIYCAICQGKFVDRGFLYGPYCPIYGFGGITVVTLLAPFSYNALLIFILTLISATTLEYITSFVMEKIFNAKWWDYSQYKFNLKGRICLLNSVEFGILGLFATYFLHPSVKELVSFIPEQYIQTMVTIFIVIITMDITITLNNLVNLKGKLITLRDLADKMIEKQNGKISDMDIFKQLEDFRKSFIERSSGFNNRIIEAFPDLSFNKLNKQFNEFKFELNRKKIEKKELIKSKKNNI
jgi:uncharacterized membrane protein